MLLLLHLLLSIWIILLLVYLKKKKQQQQIICLLHKCLSLHPNTIRRAQSGKENQNIYTQYYLIKLIFHNRKILFYLVIELEISHPAEYLWTIRMITKLCLSYSTIITRIMTLWKLSGPLRWSCPERSADDHIRTDTQLHTLTLMAS